MRRNLILLAFMALFIVPCYAQLNRELIQVYKRDGVGKQYPSYLIVNPTKNQYERHSTLSSVDEIGMYEQKGDTIILTPKYDVYLSLKIKDIEPGTTFNSVPLLFIKKGKRLINITPYESYPVFEGWLEGYNKPRFYQIM